MKISGLLFCSQANSQAASAEGQKRTRIVRLQDVDRKVSVDNGKLFDGDGGNFTVDLTNASKEITRAIAEATDAGQHFLVTIESIPAVMRAGVPAAAGSGPD